MQRAEQIARRLKLRQLEVLVAVAQFGNMAKAAGQLAITQPVVSKTIADLEKTLGMRLFDRDRRVDALWAGVSQTQYRRFQRPADRRYRTLPDGRSDCWRTPDRNQ